VVWLTDEETAPVFDIAIAIQRRGATTWEGKISTSSMRRSFADLADWLGRDNVFPSGAYLLTGTGLVPEAGFSLAAGDRVVITVPRIGTLSNVVVQGG
jgi:2-dehydro-3-deoxy-D-arabinonate dehydratase